jgi:PAS domain S-box-containing protein
MNELLAGEEYYRLLFEVTPLPALVYDLTSFAILNVNQAAIETYGYSRAEFLRATIADLLAPEDFVRVRETVSANPQRVRQKEIWQHRTKSGARIDVELSAYTVKLEEREARLVILNDITERLQKEERLRAAETYYRLLFEHSPLPAFVIDLETLQLLDVNETAVKQYGYAREEFLNLTLKDIRPPEDVPQMLRLLSQPPPGGRINELVRHQKKNGTILEVEINTFPIVYQQRRATVATAQDVTARRQLEQTLRASERQYRELYEQANDAIYTHDLQGNLTSINEAGVRFLGYSHEELIGMNMTQLLPLEDLARAQEMVQRKLTGELKYSIYEVRVRTKQGRLLPAELSTTLMFQDGQPIGVQGIARVMTERKRMEDHLRQAQKMEAVGRLAGGIAHDFNNRLTAIQGFTDLLLKRTEEADRRHYYLEQIKLASERAAELTQQLLTFSRKRALQPKLLNLNENVSDWGNLVRVLLGENIAVHLILGPDVGLVKADPAQLEHVVMNLAINACDAMPQGGDFTFETTDIEISELRAKFNPAIPPGNYVRLTIKDNGCGMSEDTMSHLFEPFYTTKEKGKGTGLGLFTAYGIIKQSGGYIEVKSAVGEGTTFLIYLPVIKDAELVKDTRVAAAGAVPGRETVLVVEDEPSVRKLVCEILQSAGYMVLEAAQGQAALALAARHEGEIELLLTDVRMPGLNGCDLWEQLKADRWELRVLFMSAYTDDVRVLEAAQTLGCAFLQKPFTPEALTRKVRTLLDQAESRVAAIA